MAFRLTRFVMNNIINSFTYFFVVPFLNVSYVSRSCLLSLFGQALYEIFVGTGIVFLVLGKQKSLGFLVALNVNRVNLSLTLCRRRTTHNCGSYNTHTRSVSVFAVFFRTSWDNSLNFFFPGHFRLLVASRWNKVHFPVVPAHVS